MTFEELIERISPKLKGIVYKIHGSCQSFSEEDLYQEAVLQLWVDYNDGKLSDKTDSYVLQSCFFYLKNHIRKVQDKTSLMRLNMPIDEGSFKLQDVLSLRQETPVEEDFDIDTLMEEVFKNELSRKEKEIAFFYLQGWTTREIAQRLGLSHVSVVKFEGKIREKCKKLKNSSAR
ncbi:MAG: sigma-70 family RNA polymerase sigma factor [Candidatus Omnitrophica bacterium]|nr:sigma-70 family RNA polymerase sigma factor [Candidatus Omnitrophota bacterium]